MATEKTSKRFIKEKPVIVIVDDDISRLDMFQRALGQEYLVFTTAGGIEAFRLIKRLNTLHVLVINNSGSRINGAEILRFIREDIPSSESIIKILITSSPDEELILDTTKNGRIDAFLKKPVAPEYLKRKIAYLLARQSKEKRAGMRVSIENATLIQIDEESSTEIELINISESGMFLRTHSLYPHGVILPFKIVLSDGKEYPLSGRITRTDIDQGGIGIEFLALDDKSRVALIQSFSDHVTMRDLTKLKERYPFLKTDEMVLFKDTLKIESLLQKALKSKIEIATIRAQTQTSENLSLVAILSSFCCVFKGDGLNIKFKTSDLIFVSFQLGYATYNFETMVYRLAPDGKLMDCLFPRVMFYSEKRNEKRSNHLGDVSIEIPLPAPFNKSIKGRITDITPNGASFITDREAPVMLKGTPLDKICILEGDNFLWEEKGEVRYVSWNGDNPSGQVKYGIQFGIGRMGIQAVQAPEIDPGNSVEEHAEEEKTQSGMRRSADLNKLSNKAPEIIRLENQRGEEIVGLLNFSLPLAGKPVPVVLIPPAFGKTKETLFSLALTLIENFFLLGKPLAVIRYDGIRRKGESYKDPEASVPPFEMLNASTSQGADDIKAVLDWLYLNPKLKASSVTLISFSLSALEARVALRDEACRRRINYWISCMGTMEFRDLMSRVNCGLDLLEQYQLGIDLGVRPILGNLISCEPYASDVVANAVATIDQAREDIRHYDIPITWIYGEHDKWIRPEFIRDIMSVHASALREVISVPSGHNARTSDEALRLFGTVTSLVYRHLYHKMIQPSLPNKKNMEIMRRAEKDRLPSRNLRNRKAYWQRYLVGEENSMGFDIMGMSADYQNLIHDQVQALELRPEDRLLDLGGGTGIFAESLLENGQSLPAHITIADLIPEALKKASEKLIARSKIMKKDIQFDLMCLDFELSRFLPVKRFLNGATASFKELADKVENLNLESANKIHDSYSPRLHRILRGQVIDPALDDWLKNQYELYEYQTIVDFNQVARYTRGLIEEKPSFRKLAFPGELEANLHLPIKPGFYNKILMSLVLSYIFNPVEILFEVRRIIKPGGLLVLSSMRPDTDASGLFTKLLDKIEVMPAEEFPAKWPKPRILESMRSFLNDAQALVDLEEAGTFDFFDPEKLDGLLEESGWESIRTIPTFGDPPQGYIIVAKVRKKNV